MDNNTHNKQIEDNAHQLDSEFDVIISFVKKINTSLSLDKMVEYTLDEVIAAFQPDLAMIFLREGETLAHAGELSKAFTYDVSPLNRMRKCFWKSIVSMGRMVHSADLSDDLHNMLEECRQVGIDSFAGVPLYTMGEISGFLVLASLTPRDFGKQAKFIQAFAAQVSTALQNVLLGKQAQEEFSNKKKAEMQLEIYRLQLEDIINLRTEELAQRTLDLEKEVADRSLGELTEREQRTLAEALIDAAAVLNSTLDLDDVLDRMLLNLENVVPHDSATVMLIGDDKDIANIARYKGRYQGQPTDTRPRSRFEIRNTATFLQMNDSKRPLIITNVEDDPNWVDLPGSEWIKSYIGSPIILDDEVIGYLNLASSKPYFFTSTHAVRLRAFANHASIAIQNARAYDQARKLAILEERQRLARDMHDVVSQTLFTASVVAEALPLQWERDQEKGKEGLDRLRRLTKGALAEMRTLLIELRPDALTKADLGDLITQVAEGATSRAEIDVSVSVGGRGPLPPDVQTEMFRIVQEIFNNIIKHARANNVIVKYNYTPDWIIIHISDDGRGFDPEQIQGERFGLRIMRERADSIGAKFEVSSQPGGGTNIEVEWWVDEG
jgi:signal transduction histidine kinase